MPDGTFPYPTSTWGQTFDRPSLDSVAEHLGLAMKAFEVVARELERASTQLRDLRESRGSDVTQGNPTLINSP